MACETASVLLPIQHTSANNRVNSPVLRPSKEKIVPDMSGEEEIPPVKGFPSKRSAAWKQRVALLAASFNVCANPSTPHIHKLARRTSMSPAEVEKWFAHRRMLEEWLQLGGASRESLQHGSAADVAAALGRCKQMLARAGLADDASTRGSPEPLPIAQTEVQTEALTGALSA